MHSYPKGVQIKEKRKATGMQFMKETSATKRNPIQNHALKMAERPSKMHSEIYKDMHSDYIE